MQFNMKIFLFTLLFLRNAAAQEDVYNIIMWPRVANETVAESTCGMYMDEIQQSIQDFMCELDAATAQNNGSTRNLRSSRKLPTCSYLCQGFKPGTCKYAYPWCSNRRRELQENDGSTKANRDLALAIGGISLVQTTYDTNSCFYKAVQIRAKLNELKIYYDSISTTGMKKTEKDTLNQKKTCASLMLDLVVKCDYSGADPITQYATAPTDTTNPAVQTFLYSDGYVDHNGGFYKVTDGTDFGYTSGTYYLNYGY